MRALRRIRAVAAGCGLLLLGACQGMGHKEPPKLDVPDPAVEAPAPARPPAVRPPPVPAPASNVKERCVPRSFPKPPKYPDTDTALRDAGGAADRYQLMAAGRLLRMHRLADLEKLLDGCR